MTKERLAEMRLFANSTAYPKGARKLVRELLAERAVFAARLAVADCSFISGERHGALVALVERLRTELDGTDSCGECDGTGIVLVEREETDIDGETVAVEREEFCSACAKESDRAP